MAMAAQLIRIRDGLWTAAVVVGRNLAGAGRGHPQLCVHVVQCRQGHLLQAPGVKALLMVQLTPFRTLPNKCADNAVKKTNDMRKERVSNPAKSNSSLMTIHPVQ